MTAVFTARFAVTGCIFADMAEIRQRVQPFVHYKDNVSALTAVTTVRSSGRYKKLSAKADMTVAAR